MSVVITSARVDAGDGRTAATIDLVTVGGGVRTVIVDGVPEERAHDSSQIYHVRLVSPDRMIPDVLHEVADYEKACLLAETYAAKLQQHADRVAELAADLAV